MFQEQNLNYSLKNIPTPSRKQYMKSLIAKTGNFLKRLRWASWFFLNKQNNDNTEEEYSEDGNTENYGFKTRKAAPFVNELSGFEKDVYHLISNIEFSHKGNNNFQRRIKMDIKAIQSKDKVIIEADKTRNLYALEANDYKKLLRDNVTKDYKKINGAVESEINKISKNIAQKLHLDDKMELFQKKQSFITLKDHKENFENYPKCRLINPSKTDIGKIAKQILESYVSKIRGITGVNQWGNTSGVTNWFTGMIGQLKNPKFLIFDIESFYPSISQQLLESALNYAESLTRVTSEEREIVLHARKSLLYHEGSYWSKKSGDLFDVGMGSNDGAETSEVVGLYILNLISTNLDVGKKYYGLYRDDGIMIINNANGPKIERIRKKLHNVFNQIGLKITTQISDITANFLDITLNLRDMSYKPYHKPNDRRIYINTKSNHPPNIIKNLPKMIETRLSRISSNKEVFNESKNYYEDALRESGYRATLKYTPSEQEVKKKKRQRKRRIIWYNPPYNIDVRSNIGRDFLQLIDKHFHKNHPLYKIINRNTIKISYSCTNNISHIIKGHNKQILEKFNNSYQPSTKNCNCRVKASCPLNGDCLSKSIVYNAKITTEGNELNYIGHTENEFKSRFRNHITSFKNQKYRHATALSKKVWELKEKRIDHSITWSIIEKSRAYEGGSRHCNLCLSEKFHILSSSNIINKKSELLSKCRHELKFLLKSYVN